MSTDIPARPTPPAWPYPKAWLLALIAGHVLADYGVEAAARARRVAQQAPALETEHA